MMTSRERVLAALNRRPADRVPFSLGFGVNEPVREALMRDLGFKSLREVDAYLQKHTDLRWVGPAYTGPSARFGTDKNGVYTDIWGVKRKPVSYGYEKGAHYHEICGYPLAGVTSIEELDGYLWPSADWFDFTVLPERIAEANAGGEYAIVMGNGNIFETGWYMRGLEQMLVDFITEPELAGAIMDRVTGFFINYFTAALEVTNKNGSTPIDIILTADDIGSQEGLMMSLPMWENMIKPRHKRLNGALHRYGVKIMYHSDGAVMEALDGFVDMGIDILEALQFDAKGMDAAVLKEKYGDRLCFHGGVSVQRTLPYGTAEDVHGEIKNLINILGDGGGFILAPSHAVQAGTPVENVKAFLSYGS
jgi:uroporphyrinogen decarboxylase